MQLTALAAVLPLLSILAQPTTATFKAGTANNADVDARSISADIQPADNGYISLHTLPARCEALLY